MINKSHIIDIKGFYSFSTSQQTWSQTTWFKNNHSTVAAVWKSCSVCCCVTLFMCQCINQTGTLLMMHSDTSIPLLILQSLRGNDSHKLWILYLWFNFKIMLRVSWSAWLPAPCVFIYPSNYPVYGFGLSVVFRFVSLVCLSGTWWRNTVQSAPKTMSQGEQPSIHFFLCFCFWNMLKYLWIVVRKQAL